MARTVCCDGLSVVRLGYEKDRIATRDSDVNKESPHLAKSKAPISPDDNAGTDVGGDEGRHVQVELAVGVPFPVDKAVGVAFEFDVDVVRAFVQDKRSFGNGKQYRATAANDGLRRMDE